ncbi:unnamed protein product [Adineta steineri]|uniref:CCHC-type domain-containing protein n=1 Tax=Adineta steineri TaxID=433720 RepID=A0A820C3H6_9BILA|nr:unnamed protein product [Adineta steineri]CAF4210054.1 unnamed protein product [Adineta steineri]
MENVSLEEAMRRANQTGKTHENKLTQLERQIDDILKSVTEYREESAKSSKAELLSMTEKIETMQALNTAYFEETTSKVNSSMKYIIEKLDLMSKPVIILPNEQKNQIIEKEELDARTQTIPTTDNIQRHTFSTNPNTGTAQWEHTLRPNPSLGTSQWGHPFGTAPTYIASEVQHTTAIPSVFPLNGVKHSIIVPPASAAPAFHGKNSESPTQFLIRVQEYAESVHAWDRLTLLNGISQFLRDSALEWYCQLRMSHRRPQTWTEFTDLFLAQFNSPVRKARQEIEWHQCKQKENETINEFLVRLRALWREQKPHETETQLVKHLFCRMRNDLLNMMGISRNTSLDEIITEVQQIEEVLYRRAKGERLSKQIREGETLPKKNHNENNSRQTSTRWNNQSSNYQVNELTPNQYIHNQNQTTTTPNWPPSINSYECYHCGKYGHIARNYPTKYGNYQQQRNTSWSKNDQGALDERTRHAPI